MIVTYEQLCAMDDAVHGMSGAAQHMMSAIYAAKCATPEDANRLRIAAGEACKLFSAAKDAYRAAKEGSCTEVFCAPATDANGSAAVEEVA